jgi:hypothetical protein
MAQTQLLPSPTIGPLVIDTVAPRVTSLVFDRLTASILVTLQDNFSGLVQSTVANPADYQLNRFVHGWIGQIIPISVTAFGLASPTAPELVRITFNGGRRIRSGKFVLTILSGGITDVAGNALDGSVLGGYPSGITNPGVNFREGLDAGRNRVFAGPNPFGIPVSRSRSGSMPSKRPAPNGGRLFPIGTIQKGRQVVNNFG